MHSSTLVRYFKCKFIIPMLISSCATLHCTYLFVGSSVQVRLNNLEVRWRLIFKLVECDLLVLYMKYSSTVKTRVPISMDVVREWRVLALIPSAVMISQYDRYTLPILMALVALYTRVSNELGAGTHKGTYSCICRDVLTITETTIVLLARGCGWQHIGAYVNLGAFYLVGIPIAAILGFWVQLRGKGLWIGIQVGNSSEGEAIGRKISANSGLM
ncbi:hypothetical protein TEA_006511 [Camellia sinensis var. sinensis]|uniref:Uncharacterized protein n=1 Tax=Camellia sinensis var. sinensis TaxID=542762 RepID=A0A4S4CVK5_CAMSN|nr:hypothetical protein TEA_006511 [Camellia sinensis var. sinensis]